MLCFHVMIFIRILVFSSFSMVCYVLMIFECYQCHDSPLLWSAGMFHAYALWMLSCHHYLIIILLCFDLLESFFWYAMLCYAICICSWNALFFGNVILSWLPVHAKSLLRLECYRIMNLSRVMIFWNASCLCSRSALSPSVMLWFHESVCNLILSCYDLMECFMIMFVECFIVVLLQCSQLFASHVMI